jgi:hypothetical protein
MGKWHLKRAPSRLREARKIIGEMPLSGDGYDDRIIDLLKTTHDLIADIEHKLNGTVRHG